MAKILIVEDEPQIRLNVQLMLSAEGHDVDQAGNGREGLRKIVASRPDMVISDVMMPELDGFGLLEAVRADPATADLPFIFLTALDDRASLRRGMNLGADDFLNKPFTRKELLEAVQTRLAKYTRAMAAMSSRLVAGDDEMRRHLEARAAGTRLDGEHIPTADVTGKMMSGTVLFSDIRNFTTISERLTSSETAELLNAYFQKACAPVLAMGGRVEKLLGDGMMAVFLPRNPLDNTARAAIAASIEIAKAAYRFRDWIHQHHGPHVLPEFSVGVGMHSGEMIETTMGPAGSSATTLIGDSINVAARLEAMTKELGWPIIASRTTVDAAGTGIHTGRATVSTLRGRSAQIEAVEITGIDQSIAAVGETGELPAEIREALATNAERAARTQKALLDETRQKTSGKPTQEAPAPEIAGYRIRSMIGQGGMARVFLAEQESDGQLVVLKVLNTKPTEDPEMFERFAQEFALLSSAQHNNVVKIHDLGVADDCAYIVMEYLPRGTLREVIGKGLNPRQALSVLAQLAGGLAELHSRGIIHRDLKSNNIMVRDDGTMAIADFGIAMTQGGVTEHAVNGELLGTPYYFAPEMIQGAQASVRSDLYALGVIFFEMLTGRRPYEGSDISDLVAQHLSAPIPALPEDASDCQVLLNRLMSKKPEHRYASAEELLAAIDDVWTARSVRSMN